jgi:hypothetical protein
MTPLDNNSPDEPNAPDPVETRDASSAPVPRRQRSIWLFLIPGIVLILVGLFWMARSERHPAEAAPRDVTGTSGRELGKAGDTSPAAQPLNPSGEGPDVIGDLSLVGADDAYVGRAVELAAVPITSVEGSRTFTVGRIGNRTLVLLDKAQPEIVKSGQHVRISGRIEKPPTGDRLAAAGLSEDDRKAVEDEKVVIHATRVEVAHEATPTARPTDSR